MTQEITATDLPHFWNDAGLRNIGLAAGISDRVHA